MHNGFFPFFLSHLRIHSISLMAFWAIREKCLHHTQYKSFIFQKLCYWKCWISRKKSEHRMRTKNSSYSCKRTSIINVSQFLNPWLWKNTWGIFIETKSSNKTDPTLLTCASSFSSSTCTIVTVHNVDVNTSCMRAQRHFSCFPFPCNAASRSTHMIASSFCHGQTFKRIFSELFSAYHALKCTKGTVLLSQIYSIPIHVRNLRFA